MKTWLHALRPLAGYVMAAAALTWPLAISLTTRLGAPEGPGDPYLNLWILGWGLRAWTTDPSSVFTGRVFDANIFHPAPAALTYSDHMLLQSGALAPLYALSGNPVLCYNVLVLGSIALSGWAMHVTARALTGSSAAAWCAGLAWACWPYRTAHLIHIQLQGLYFLPLALLLLHRVIAARHWRDAAWLGVVAALQAVTSAYYGLMTGIVLAVGALAITAMTGGWRRRLASRLLLAALLALALTAPVMLPYLRTQVSEGFGRTLFEAANHSASLSSYLQVPASNLVYGRLPPAAVGEPVKREAGVERQLFPGVLVSVLALAGAVHGWRRDKRALVALSAALVVTGVGLSLGPGGWRAGYAALHDHVYGFQAVRAPARFAVIAFLGWALLAAVGVVWMGQALAARVRAARLVTWVLAVVIGGVALEFANRPLALAAAPPRATEVGAWLRDEPGPGAVLYMPLDSEAGNTVFMVQSLEHGRPIVNGYSGQRPALFSSVVEAIAGFPASAALAALRDIDVRFVVAPAPVSVPPASPLVERVRFAGGVVYELQWTPEAVAALQLAPAAPPPPAGSAPFDAGEQLDFDVYWESGPLDVPAGTARLHVARAAAGGEAVWQFEALAETADWVSTFFAARDRFVTTADANLRPLTHQREIREGRRAVDRAFVFDWTAAHVRTGASLAAATDATAVTLPLQPDARDALTVLYYLRTLPLTPGSTLSLPLNEAGTSLHLDVAVDAVETIEHHAQPVAALKLTPRIIRRVERRQPIALEVWLSTDGRRIPLRVVAEAGFGRVRVEWRRATASR